MTSGFPGTGTKVFLQGLRELSVVGLQELDTTGFRGTRFVGLREPLAGTNWLVLATKCPSVRATPRVPPHFGSSGVGVLPDSVISLVVRIKSPIPGCVVREKERSVKSRRIILLFARLCQLTSQAASHRPQISFPLSA